MLILLFTLGSFLFISGGLWLLFLAFSESILWGLGSLLFWPVMPIAFALTTWPRARLPLILHIAGILVLLLGGVGWLATHAQGMF